MFLELSIRSARNCLAPFWFWAKFHTTEQLVTWGTATMVLDPLSGGWRMIFLATSGSCFSAARKRLMALIVHEVLRASMALTLPEGPQVSCSGAPAP